MLHTHNMSTLNQIKNLIKRFEQQIETYQQSDYNETQTRNDFINPFFMALGWDVNNEQGVSEICRPVVHEDTLKIGRATKMPDYSFRVGGKRKFFVEAKKPSINLKTDQKPAYQLRRYGWNAKLSLSIVTNFSELAVYDCRVKPDKDDDPSIGRVLYLKYTDYLKHWDELVEKFSFDGVWQGRFDQYAAKKAITKGAIEVDAAFLAEMESWREKLAHHLFSKNPTLTQRQLNFSVQQIIDRIVFLRICEDRGIEDYGQLLTLLNSTKVYQRLFRLFRLADTRYNSGLFHFKAEKGRKEPDALTPSLLVDDDILKNILKNLYYPDSPYEFSVLPADILGQVYEQFLGKVIRLNKTHQAIIEEKPEVKKAGGVYYTPTYIVNYIVEKTLSPFLTGKKVGPRSAVNQLKILDPACGSGSFLLGAYQFLLDWHLEHYLKNPKKWSTGKNPRLYQAIGKTWKLTVNERKRILLNNIYGVDIDPQAVEVTKLSLLLKVLEDEQSVISQFSLLKERVLPDIDNNIKCGNSLISPDFYQGQQLDFENEETLYRINAFDWETEFAFVLKVGGFDVVIGNPPYVRQELLNESKDYFQTHYQTYHGVADLYVYFIEKGISLLRDNGFFGIIVSNKWMRANYAQSLRLWLKQQGLIEIVDFGDLPVFQQATTYPCILRIQKAQPQTTFQVAQLNTLDFEDLKTEVATHAYHIEQSSLNEKSWSLADKNTQALLEKLHNQGVPLNEYIESKIFYGIKTGLNEAFVIDAKTRDKLIANDTKSEELIKPFLLGKDIKRYQPLKTEHYLILIPKGWTRLKSQGTKNAWAWLKRHYPSIANHLQAFSKNAQKRYDQGEYWWELRGCDYYDEFEKPKIILPDISVRGNFTFDSDGKFYCVNTAYIIPNTDKYLLGVLNSKLMTFYYSHLSATYRGGYLRFIYQYLVQLPIYSINLNNPTANHDKMVQLVEQMLKLNQKLTTNLDSHSKTVLKRQIEALDRQIDLLVYQLYHLTTQEIELVEKG
jgi:type I restriction-modification system DNA methylase subunit